ncbi:MAG: hypothetical protein COA96_07300 [SAR86 cluster bacterium]|uniref:Transposase IS200-like domain-containing protein n=1 Tax=SAR86 cluster bacterium TaxID=2030880 RepID=A0A2A5B1N1_9GAMM|nr:MAG: hypothetical protein COA96_07300 [SAR86 cluster bacterium]
MYCAGETYFAVIKEGMANTGFIDDACYEYYHLRLMNCLNIYQIQLHAYLLKPKEIWLLFTPKTPQGFDALLGYLNKTYSNYFNIRFDRSVNAWAGTPITCSIPKDNLILDCQKFIEREPLRAKLVKHPGEYLWSSYCTNSFNRSARYLTAHRSFKLSRQSHRNNYSQYRDFIVNPFKEAYYLFLENRLLTGRSLITPRRNQHVQLQKYC